MSIYQRSQATASRLLGQFSQGVVVYEDRIRTGGEDWAPIYETVSLPLDAAVKGVGQMFKDSSLINESDLLVTCAVFGATPTTSGSVLIDGVRHTVVQVQQVPGAGIPVAWRIVVRRG